ncbi:hypothetical protein AB6A40_003780 [Gnathostoma spinigerum]|uniref:Uncharacterized protein n=1 Tax=Gnathostoma spinigerum TaxID=75299 RepID=A0ABD6ECZ7_9BILA
MPSSVATHLQMDVNVSLLFSLIISVAYAELYTVTVRGQLACKDKSVQNVRVELRESDFRECYSFYFLQNNSPLLNY